MEGETGGRTTATMVEMAAVVERRAGEALEGKALGAPAVTAGFTSPSTTKREGFLSKCTNCSGFGRKKDKCPSAEEKVKEANVAVVSYESDCNSVDDQSF